RLRGARALDQHRPPGRRGGRDVRADRDHRPGRVAAELGLRGRRAARPALASVPAPSVKRLVEIVVPLALVALWWVWPDGAQRYYCPPLGDVFTAFNDTWVFERVREDVVPSLYRLLSGYFIAVAVGISLGVVFGLRPALRRMASPCIEFLRAI